MATTKISPPFKGFGRRLAESRLNAGISSQADLAKRIEASQQTLSRWERGISRPTTEQIRLLVHALSQDRDVKALERELVAAAGYLNPIGNAAVVSPFPTAALSPDTFEEFVAYLLQVLYPEAKIHRLGKTGHTQGGSDIEVSFRDGRTQSYQCKRVDQFGPTKIDQAVADYTRAARDKFIVLSRVASPDARDAITKHSDWDIYDRDDLSRLIRQKLSREHQIRLVDLFFPGQRLALLGETEAGPWQSTDEFFAPFRNQRHAFNHEWSLIGRESDVVALQQLIEDDTKNIVFLTAPGGGGKSRVLKEALRRPSKSGKSRLVRFLSPTEAPTIRTLEHLGSGAKLVVVDDAIVLSARSVRLFYSTET